MLSLRPWAGAPRPTTWMAERAPTPEASQTLAHWIYQERQARLVTAPDGEVLWISAAARTRLEADASLSIRDGWLTGATHDTSQRLRSLLGAVSSAAPCWLSEDDGTVIWAQYIQSSGAGCVGLTFRYPGEGLDVGALAEIRQLTGAQTRILGLMLRGTDAAEIAVSLDISVETLRTHVKHVYRKLGVKNRGALFAMAMLFAQA